MAIANSINNTPIAIKIMDKIFEIPKSLSGKLLLWTVVVFVVGEVVDVLVDEEVFVVVFILGVLVEFELLDVFDVFDVFDVLEVLDVALWLFVSLIFISTAKTLVEKDNNINNIDIIENIFKLLIIFLYLH